MTVRVSVMVVIAALLAPAQALSAAPKTAADEALYAARAEYQGLRKDEGRRRYRHNWLNVARKFELLSQRFPKSDRAPEALFLAGELFNELNRFSSNPDDLGFAEKSYKKLIDGWPKHRLSDDAALSLAHLLADRKDDPAGARKVIEKALDDAKDKKRELASLLGSLKEAARASGKKAKDDEDDDAPAVARSAAKRTKDDGDDAPAVAKSASKRSKDKDDDDARAAAKSASKRSKEKDDDDAPAVAKSASKRSKDKDDDDAPAAAKSGAKAGAKGSSPGKSAGGALSIGAMAQAAGKAPAAAKASREEGSASAELAHAGAAKAPPGSALKPGVAEAIRRLTTTTAALVSPHAEAVAREKEQREEEQAREAQLKKDELQARRLPPVRPREEEKADAEAPSASDDVDEGSPTAIAALQERLRDVRVGAKKPALAEVDAKVRLQKLAVDEQRAEVTLAEQLGLKVRRVIVDAGHGGHDSGAIGLKGTREKDVSLGIAKKLGARLEEMGLEVVMTRDDDTFVKLEDRTRIANKEKGDLFISVHCNAAPSRKLRGIETYTLNISSNRYSMRLAARENASSEKGISDLQYILADLATKANVGESTRLAERVQKGLIRTLTSAHKDIADLGTKEALFFVLLGAKMPSILVETSFISNPEDEQRLASDEYQAEIAGSIAESVGDFLEERNKLAQLE